MPKRTKRKAAPTTKSSGSFRRRYFWKGTITFGLVNIPVEFYSAVRAAKTRLRLLSRNGTPLTRQYYCPDDGKVLSPDEIVRGYETDAGLVAVEEEELDALAPEKSQDIRVQQFVERSELQPLVYELSFFLVPSEGSALAYSLLGKALEDEKLAGIATFVMRGKEHLVAIISENNVLRAELLRFADEIRSAAEINVPDSKADNKMVSSLSSYIKKNKRKRLETSAMKDTYTAKLNQLVNKKAKVNKDIYDNTQAVAETDEDKFEGGQVVDLMAILKQRLSDGATEQPTARGRAKKKQPSGARKRQTKAKKK